MADGIVSRTGEKMIRSLPQVLEQAATRYANREAVRCQQQSLSYAELHRRAASLAATLARCGVRRGERVGIYLNKSLESVVAIYGIMRAGAAYVPLDPFAPITRLRQIISDCGIHCLVSHENKVSQLHELVVGSELECLIGVATQPDLMVHCLAWDEALNNAEDNWPELNESDLAYILYTSGSTGTPKGIVHTHSSALAFARWAASEYGLTPADRVSNHAPFHFDLSTFDLFAAAQAGAGTVIIPEYLTKFPAALTQLAIRERLTVWYSVPHTLIQLLDRGGLLGADLRELRWVLFAGEPFPTKHLRRVMAALPQARFSNLYGPTETNVCTYYHVDRWSLHSDEPIPIGRPCPGTEMLVVDEQDNEVGAGEVGELLVCGPTVMRGYWGRPDLDARGFLRTRAGLFYRTGDLVRLWPDRFYRYLGRRDRQIKTRGYRVELDEIEAALLTHAGVHEAAVYALPDADGENLIEGVVIAKCGTAPAARELLKHLAARLPTYALPASITVAADLPRTLTGKVDRQALQKQARLQGVSVNNLS